MWRAIVQFCGFECNVDDIDDVRCICCVVK